ncbi:MAG: hypothetical protein NTZ11_16895 [Gammaproteobacteria bacterium]|nr:hypothetical protein [Gammaproteobacteria bacterium]
MTTSPTSMQPTPTTDAGTDVPMPSRRAYVPPKLELLGTGETQASGIPSGATDGIFYS